MTGVVPSRTLAAGRKESLIGSPATERFLGVLNTSAALQRRLQRCRDAEAVLAAAAALNCPLTRSDLVLLGRPLVRPWDGLCPGWLKLPGCHALVREIGGGPRRQAPL